MTRRLIDYRTFGILLLNEKTQELEMKVAVRYGEKVELPRVKVGSGLVGYAALHKEPVLVPDVSVDPRYIKVVDDVRSELVIPLLLQDRCIGVFDLEATELNAFNKRHAEILSLLASQAAVAIENARLYETILANELRMEKELRFAQRVQAALLPADLPKRLKGVDVAARFMPARELGGDLYDFLAPDPNSLVVAVGDVSGKGVPAALYSAFVGELVRSRTFRRRFTSDRFEPRGRPGLDEHDPQRAPAGGVLLHALLCRVRLQTPHRHPGEFRSAVSDSLFGGSGEERRDPAAGSVAQIELPGVPLGLFAGSTYDEVVFDLAAGDVYVFCSDGVFEASNAAGTEFGATRLLDVVGRNHQKSARDLVDAIVDALQEFRGDTAPNDDMTRWPSRSPRVAAHRPAASLPLHVERFLPQVQAERLAAEHGDLVDAALDADPLASGRHPCAL